MNFKDAIQKDLGVFVNANEFAEVHVVDGVEMEIVIDTDTLKGRDRQPMDLYNNAAGVYVGSITVYARSCDFEDRPVVDQHITIDEKLYLVSSISESMGLLEIQLEANAA